MPDPSKLIQYFIMKRLVFISILVFISVRAFSQFCESDKYLTLYQNFHYNLPWIIYDDSLFRHKENDSLMIPSKYISLGYMESSYPDTLIVPLKDSVVYYYPDTKIPYYVISNKGTKTQIIFHDLFSSDTRSLVLNNEDFYFEKLMVTGSSPPYKVYPLQEIAKTRPYFLTKKHCFSEEAKDTCVTAKIADIQLKGKRNPGPGLNFSYYYVSIALTNKCEVDQDNYCLNIAEFHLNSCTREDFFITNNIGFELKTCWDCPFNPGLYMKIKPGETIRIDSLFMRVDDAECLKNNKCKIGLVYMNWDEWMQYQGDIKAALIDKKKKNTGIIWTDEFSIK